MMHPTTVYDQSKHPDPNAFAHGISDAIREDIFKAMALVLFNGQPVAFVHCDTTMWAAISGCYENTGYGERHTVSIAWLPFDHMGPDSVWSLTLDESLWFACCENPEKMRMYLAICFGDRDGDDQASA